MYSFAQRADTTAIDEPLYGYYLKQTEFIHPGYFQIIESMECDLDKLKIKFTQHEYPTPLVFFKQMCHHILYNDYSWIKGMKNIMLIRHPALVINSYVKVIEEISIDRIGIATQMDLYNHLSNTNEHVVVISSQSILENPEHALKQLCNALDIPFDKAMLKWPVGPKKEDGCWAPYWYTNIHKSKGFEKSENKNITVLPQHQSLLEECMMHFNKLKSCEIKL
jgi:hypothetical protein